MQQLLLRSRLGTRSLSSLTAGAAAAEAASDAAWIAANRAVAGAAMTPPSSPPPGERRCIDDGAAQHLEEYLKWRCWPSAESETARRLVSAALSFPLTVAHYSARVLDHSIIDASATCVGARAEATLPIAFWHELAVATERSWSLEMVGPHVRVGPNGPAPAARSLGRGSGGGDGVVVAATSAAFYHDYVEAVSPPPPSLFCLFNPGMGQAEWKSSWRPTLIAALATRRPLLCTSFSERDLDADVAFLRSLETEGVLRWLEEPAPNPFASRRSFVDPMATDHVVQVNAYAFVVQQTSQ